MLNFLPQNYIKKVNLGYLFRTYVFLFTFIFLAVIVLILLFVPSAIFSRYKNNTVASQLESTKMVNGNEGVDAVSLIKKLNGIVKALTDTGPVSLTPSGLIHKIIALKNTDIKISAISLSNIQEATTRIVITGISNTRDSLTLFNNSLISDGTFATVDLPISNLIKSTDAGFNITLTYMKK